MVVICFHFTIFVVLETTGNRKTTRRHMLWFAFILLSLSYWKQRARAVITTPQVVICFHFTIFVVLETTRGRKPTPSAALWFAFILLSLSYWKQPVKAKESHLVSCDLLSFYYLCRTGNNLRAQVYTYIYVVICFHFTIFVVLETTGSLKGTSAGTLWFAFILLSLSYLKQLVRIASSAVSRCDLLSFYYLCRTWNNDGASGFYSFRVVICFHFTIFVVLETTLLLIYSVAISLWFAFILLSLSYLKQPKSSAGTDRLRCDLLSFYYLCRTWNNRSSASAACTSVVICFHFTIFVVLETTRS